MLVSTIVYENMSMYYISYFKANVCGVAVFLYQHYALRLHFAVCFPWIWR